MPPSYESGIPYYASLDIATYRSLWKGRETHYGRSMLFP